jgi:hypothetical protein
MSDELCTYWRSEDWCGCDNVPRTTPGIRCPFDSDSEEQKKFCRYYTYHGIEKGYDGKYSIIINGKKIISGITGEDLSIIETLLEQTNYDI